MPNPAQIATVNAGGQIYGNWQSVSIERRYPDIVSHMTLDVAEFPNKGTWPSVQLMPWTSARGFLAGQLAISGQVCVRQAVYSAEQHLVRIVVASTTQPLTKSTVQGRPGQYRDYTWQQIAQTVAGQVGVNVQLQGAPAGAAKPFPRVSEHIGEARFAFIDRLARMRNLYLRDDANGNLVATQGTGGVCATLIEGKNIKSARIVFRNNEYSNPVKTVGANAGGSSTGVWGDPARTPNASVTTPLPADAPETIVAEEICDSQDCAMRAARQAAWNLAQYIEGDITVVGWQLDNGALWLDQIGNLVTIMSPMLAPVPSITLAIKGVISSQDDENGTQTVIEICDPGSLGSLGQIQTAASSGSPAQPGVVGGVNYSPESLG